MGCNHNLTSGTPRKPIGTIHCSTRTHRKVQRSKDAQANSDSNGLPLLLHIVLLRPDYFNKIVHGKRNLMIPKCLTKTYPCHKLVTCAIFPWHSQWEPILIGYCIFPLWVCSKPHPPYIKHALNGPRCESVEIPCVCGALTFTGRAKG